MKELSNPWNKVIWEDFLYFCCPTCDQKDKSKDDFIKHAMVEHGNAKEAFLYEIKTEILENNDEDSSDLECLPIEVYDNFKEEISEEPKKVKGSNKKSKSVPVETTKKNRATSLLNSNLAQRLSALGCSLQINTSKEDSSKKESQAIELNCQKCGCELKNSNDGVCDFCSEQVESVEDQFEIQHPGFSEEKVNQNGNTNPVQEIDSNLKCDNCGRSNFLSPGELKWHKTNLLCIRSQIKATRSNYMTTCNICQKSVVKVNLENHQATAHKMYKYRCDICFSDFPNREDLTAHKTKEHPKRAEKLNCDKCGKLFDFKHQLKKHIKIVHDNIRDQKCSHCDKSFKTKDVLKEHIASVHEGVKHICAFCGRSYNRRSDLSVHVKVRHNQDTKKHVCDECGKSFDFAKSLQKHVSLPNNSDFL